MATAKKLPSGNWRIRVGAGEAGKSVSFTAETKKAVEIMAAEYLVTQQNPERKTLEVCSKEYIDSRRNMRSPSTIAGYEKILRCNMDGIKGLKLSAITQQQLQTWVDSLCKTLSPKSVINAFGFVRSVIIYHRGAFNYTVSLPSYQLPVVTMPDPNTVIKAVVGSEIELPCMLAIWLGMRMSEIRAARKSDIKDGVLTISETVVTVGSEHIRKSSTKTYRTRRLRLPQYIIDLINKLPPDQDELTTLSGQAIYKRFVRLMEKSGIQGLTFHNLRHLNASVMAKLRVPEKYAMERGGWSTPKIMRDVYTHTFSDEAEAVADAIDDYFSAIM